MPYNVDLIKSFGTTQESSVLFPWARGVHGAVIPKSEDWDDLINKLAEQYPSVPANVVKSLIEAESGWKTNATVDTQTKYGMARGLGQFIDETAKRFIPDWKSPSDSYNPEKNIAGIFSYLNHLQKQYGSMEKAIAMYLGSETQADKFGTTGKQHATNILGKAGRVDVKKSTGYNVDLIKSFGVSDIAKAVEGKEPEGKPKGGWYKIREVTQPTSDDPSWKTPFKAAIRSIVGIPESFYKTGKFISEQKLKRDEFYEDPETAKEYTEFMYGSEENKKKFVREKREQERRLAEDYIKKAEDILPKLEAALPPEWEEEITNAASGTLNPLENPTEALQSWATNIADQTRFFISHLGGPAAGFGVASAGIGEEYLEMGRASGLTDEQIYENFKEATNIAAALEYGGELATLGIGKKIPGFNKLTKPLQSFLGKHIVGKVVGATGAAVLEGLTEWTQQGVFNYYFGKTAKDAGWTEDDVKKKFANENILKSRDFWIGFGTGGIVGIPGRVVGAIAEKRTKKDVHVETKPSEGVEQPLKDEGEYVYNYLEEPKNIQKIVETYDTESELWESEVFNMLSEEGQRKATEAFAKKAATEQEPAVTAKKPTKNKLGELLDDEIIDKGTYDDAVRLNTDGWELVNVDKDGTVELSKIDETEGEPRTIILRGIPKEARIESKAPVEPVKPSKEVEPTKTTPEIKVAQKPSMEVTEQITEKEKPSDRKAEREVVPVQQKSAEEEVGGSIQQQKPGREEGEAGAILQTPEEIAKELNLNYDGIQEGAGVMEDMHQFTIQEKGKESTLLVPISKTNLENVKKEYNETLEGYKKTRKVKEPVQEAIPESTFKSIEKRLFNVFGKRKPDKYFTDMSIDDMRKFMTKKGGAIRLSETAINELSDRTIGRIRDMLARTNGGAEAIFKKFYGYMTRSKEGAAIGVETGERESTEKKVEKLQEIQNNLIEYDEDNPDHVAWLKSKVIKKTKYKGIDKEYISLTIEEDLTNRDIETHMRPGERVLQDLMAGTTGKRVDIEQISKDDLYEQVDMSVYETPVDEKGTDVPLKVGKHTVRGNLIKTENLTSNKYFMDGLLYAIKNIKKAAAYGLKNPHIMEQYTKTPGEIHSGMLNILYHVLHSDTTFDDFKTKQDYDNHIKTLYEIDKLRQKYIIKPYADNNTQSTTIAKLIEDGKLDSKVGNIIISALEAMDIPTNFAFDVSDAGNSFYSLARNLITIRKNRIEDLTHEIGHFAYYNLLTPEQRYDYGKTISNKYFVNNKIDKALMAKHLAVDPRFTNVLDSAGEYFADQFMQYVHHNILSEQQHKSIIQRTLDFYLKFFNNMRERLYIDPDVLPYIEQILAHSFANTKEADIAIEEYQNEVYDGLIFEDPISAKERTISGKGIEKNLERARRTVNHIANELAIEKSTTVDEARRELVLWAVNNLDKRDIRKNFLQTITSKNLTKMSGKNWDHAMGVVRRMRDMGIKRRAIHDAKKAIKGVDINKLPPEIRDELKETLKQYDLVKMLTATRDKLEAYEALMYNTDFLDAAQKKTVEAKTDRLKKIALIDKDVIAVQEISEKVQNLVHEGKKQLIQLRKYHKLEREYRKDETVISIKEVLADKQHRKLKKKLDKLFKKMMKMSQIEQDILIQGIPPDLAAAMQGVAYKIPRSAIKDFAKSIDGNLSIAESICNALDGEREGIVTKNIFNELDEGQRFVKEYKFKMRDFFEEKLKESGVKITGWSESEFGGLVSSILNEKGRLIDVQTIELESGKKLHLTKMEKISVYRSALRAQGVKHILEGGLVRDITSLFKERENYNITKDDLLNLFNSMTEEEMVVSDIFTEWFEMQRVETNKHSSKTIGYDVIPPEVENYHPLRINDIELERTIKDPVSIETMNKNPRAILPGVLRKTTEGAVQALVIEDALQTTVRSSAQIGRYIGLSSAIKKVGNLLNDIGISMTETGLTTEYEQLKNAYNREALHDNSMFREGNVGMQINIAQRAQIVGRLGYRVSTQLVQPVSAFLYFTEDGIEMDASILKNVSPNKVRNMIERLAKANANFRDRFEGNVSRDLRENYKSQEAKQVIANTKDKKGIRKKIRNIFSIPGAMRGITKMDASACAFGGLLTEQELIRENKWGKPGDTQFEEELGKRTWKHTRRTQPVFDQLYRGTYHTSQKLKWFTLFCSQRAQNYIVTKRAFAKMEQGKVASGLRDLLIVHAIQPAFIMAIKEGWRFLRGKSDEEKLKDPWYWLKMYGIIEVSNLLVLGGGLVALLGDYEVSAGAYTNFFSDLKTLWKTISQQKKKEKAQKIYRSFVRFLGNFGIPLSGVQEQIDAITTTAERIQEANE